LLLDLEVLGPFENLLHLIALIGVNALVKLVCDEQRDELPASKLVIRPKHPVRLDIAQVEYDLLLTQAYRLPQLALLQVSNGLCMAQ
jgi:hypothetical protein